MDYLKKAIKQKTEEERHGFNSVLFTSFEEEARVQPETLQYKGKLTPISAKLISTIIKQKKEPAAVLQTIPTVLLIGGGSKNVFSEFSAKNIHIVSKQLY